MPKPYPREFRDDVVAVARRGQAPLKQVAQDFGISESCLVNWLKAAAGHLDRPRRHEDHRLNMVKRRIETLDAEARTEENHRSRLRNHIVPRWHPRQPRRHHRAHLWSTNGNTNSAIPEDKRTTPHNGRRAARARASSRSPGDQPGHS